MTSPIEAERAALERREAQLAEYGQWEATDRIMFGNALAYDVGHPVPVSAVEMYGYDKQGLVKRVATKTEAAKSADETTAEEAPPSAAEDSSQANTGRASSAKKGS
jgi:hypothetical protein